MSDEADSERRLQEKLSPSTPRNAPSGAVRGTRALSIPTRSAQEVITSAINENKLNEYLLYAFALLTFLVGTAIIIWSLIEKQPIATLAGAVESALFAPAVYYMRQLRRENLKLRMIEVPLSLAKSANEARTLITELFSKELRDTKQDHGLSSKTRSN